MRGCGRGWPWCGPFVSGVTTCVDGETVGLHDQNGKAIDIIRPIAKYY
jgi:hypothetical protein